jgi:hypothetical protein
MLPTIRAGLAVAGGDGVGGWTAAVAAKSIQAIILIPV